MTPFFEPNYTVLSFFFAQKFIYIQLLALLALLRTALGQGPSRWVAALVALISVTLIVVIFAPALNLTAQGWYAPLARLLAFGQGMMAPLVLSAAFALSAVVPGRRLWLLDWIHLTGVAAFLCLWIVIQI